VRMGQFLRAALRSLGGLALSDNGMNSWDLRSVQVFASVSTWLLFLGEP
jgi:hypothetical protein